MKKTLIYAKTSGNDEVYSISEKAMEILGKLDRMESYGEKITFDYDTGRYTITDSKHILAEGETEETISIYFANAEFPDLTQTDNPAQAEQKAKEFLQNIEDDSSWALIPIVDFFATICLYMDRPNDEEIKSLATITKELS